MLDKAISLETQRLTECRTCLLKPVSHDHHTGTILRRTCRGESKKGLDCLRVSEFALLKEQDCTDQQQHLSSQGKKEQLIRDSQRNPRSVHSEKMVEEEEISRSA